MPPPKTPDGGAAPKGPDGGAPPKTPDGGAAPKGPDGGAAPKAPDGGAAPKAPDGGAAPKAPGDGDLPPGAVPPDTLPPPATAKNGTDYATGNTNAPKLPDPYDSDFRNPKNLKEPPVKGEPIAVLEKSTGNIWLLTPASDDGKTPPMVEYKGKVNKDGVGIPKGQMPSPDNPKEAVDIPIPKAPDPTKTPEENGMGPGNQALKDLLPNVKKPVVDANNDVWEQQADGKYVYLGKITNGDFYPV